MKKIHITNVNERAKNHQGTGANLSIIASTTTSGGNLLQSVYLSTTINYKTNIFLLLLHTADKPGTCPAPKDGSFGVCAELCSNDHDCPNSQKCCSNGCGRACSPPGKFDR